MPFGEEPSPPQVNAASPTNANPLLQLNVHTALKLIMVQDGAGPLSGALRAGHVMAIDRGNIKE